MICPVCKKDMFVLEYKRIELDYCQSCKGVWFDSGELELLLEAGGVKNVSTSLSDVLKFTEAQTAEKKRHCPICARNMKKVKIGGEAGVMIDACIQNDGLWFDSGEVTSIIKIMAEKSVVKGGTETEIMSFLRDVFQSE